MNYSNLSPIGPIKGWSRPQGPNWASKTIALAVGVLAMVFFIAFIVWAQVWTEPGSPPPGGNVPAPINVGPTAQTKTGNLTLSNLYLNAVGNEGNVERVNMIIGYDDLHLRSDAGNNTALFLEDSPQRASFYFGGTERWRIDSTGTLTIGSVPWARLTSLPADCSAGDYVYGLDGGLKCSTPPGGITTCSDCDPRFVNVTGDTMTGSLTINTSGNDKILLRGTQASPHTIWLGDSKGVRFWDNLTGELMRITNTGDVSIPNGSLTVTQDITAQSGIVLGGERRTTWPEGAAGYWIQSGSNLYPNDNGWNVGIGTTSPGSKLHVSGGTGLVNVLIEADTDNSGEADQPSIILRQDGGIVEGRLGYFNSTNQLTLKNVYNDALHLGTNNTNRLTILGNGNVGIGISPIGAKLHVADSAIKVSGSGWDTMTIGGAGRDITSTGNIYMMPGGTTAGSNFSGSGGNIQNLSLTGNLSFNGEIKPDGATCSDGQILKKTGSNNWDCVDMSAGDGLPGGIAGQTLRHNGTSWVANSVIYNNGTNVGIGTISPDSNYKLTTSGGGVKAENSSAGQPAGYFSNAGGGPALQTGTGDLLVGGDLIVGGGTGKLTVGTIDPIFEIDGEKYATYVADFVGGVRTETSGVVRLKNGKYVIDFDNLEKGSDLWLFWQTSNKNLNDVAVLLTPSFEGKVWYEKDGNTITIYGEKAGEVSYRLSAPRIDHKEWDNLADNQSSEGIIVSNY